MTLSLRAHEVSCSHGGRAVVRAVSFEARAGTLTALLGPNGAGKSTLLRALAGLGPYRGQILLGGAPLESLERREVARAVAYVAQDPPADVPFTVAELVLMGRAPHLGRWALEGRRDRELAEEAMRTVELLELAERPIDQLSGGERRRAFLARAIAQGPRVLLLDEPTAFLDLGHQTRVLEYARGLAREGLCVLAVLHDPNLAAAFADQVLLLRAGELLAQGPAPEVLQLERLEALYGMRLVQAAGPRGEGPIFASPGFRDGALAGTPVAIPEATRAGAHPAGAGGYGRPSGRLPGCS